MNKCSLFLLFLSSCATSHVVGNNFNAEIDRDTFESFAFTALPAKICDGPKPLINLTHTVTIKPFTQKNIPMSVAAARNVELREAMAEYLKVYFLDNVSNPFLQNDNFSDCTKYGVYMGSNGSQTSCWVKASNYSRNILNRSVSDLYPVLLSHAPDLAQLRETYTFMPPKEVAEEWLGEKLREMTSEQAIKYRERLWHGFFVTAALKEAEREDGTIGYELTLDMGPFCRYGTLMSNLITR